MSTAYAVYAAYAYHAADYDSNAAYAAADAHYAAAHAARYAALQGLIEEQLADDRCNVRRREGRRPRDGGAAGAARWWSEAGEDALANVGILG